MIDLDREAEERYLVALLQPVTLRSLRDEALTRVQARDFGSGRYGGIWAAAQRLRERDLPIDRRNLLAEARTEAGGHLAEQILDGLDGYLPTASSFPTVVNGVITAGKIRRLLVSIDRARQRAETAEDFGAAYSAALDELENVADRDTETTDLTPISVVLADLEREFKSSGPRRHTIASPWVDFNERAAGGFHRGRLHVIGGRPGEGKSIAGHQAAAYAAEAGYPAVIFSMEMGNLEVGGRLLANGSRIDMGEIARSSLAGDSWVRMAEFKDRASAWPLWVVDRSNLTVDYIKSVCRTQKRRAGLDVVCVDYLQLLGMQGIQSREQQVSEIARQFKNLARELDCAVLLPSQLNRDTAKRGKPSLADLRESGGIEAHADLVVLLARQVFPEGHEAAGQYNGLISLDIAKNRFGPTGAIELPWRGCYASIG